jgi:hypothetical protein
VKPRPIIDLVQRLEAVELELAAYRETAAAHIDSLEAENKALRQYAGQTRSMAMSALVELASIQHHVGMEPPKRKTPVGLPVKQVAEQTGYSQSGLRKMAKAAEAAGAPIAERIGGRLFFDVDKLPTKR